ncbi:hypothetical protein Taro_052357 [Colocasia esculenta]|uniref:Uncharacterized protein n=1 Tax=Colocasia esculenta TaxID=4460 RepID=A0A843XIE0_COLES|nr:hypothetical protein [Colocasia esculenta]
MSRCRIQKATEDPVALRVSRVECLCMVMLLTRCLRGLSGVHVVCVCVASSMMPTVVTSSIGSPRFCVSQAQLYVWLRERRQRDSDL